MIDPKELRQRLIIRLYMMAAQGRDEDANYLFGVSRFMDDADLGNQTLGGLPIGEIVDALLEHLVWETPGRHCEDADHLVAHMIDMAVEELGPLF